MPWAVVSEVPSYSSGFAIDLWRWGFVRGIRWWGFEDIYMAFALAFTS